MKRRDVEQKFSNEMAEWEKDPYTFAPPGGESGLAVTARALPALIDLVRERSAKNILVVSHKATIRLLLSSLLGFDPRRYRDNLDQKPAALNVVDFRDPTRVRLTLFNDTSHYHQPAKRFRKFRKRACQNGGSRARRARCFFGRCFSALQTAFPSRY
jgi:broad specificity phosphatase PhoE